MTICFGELEGQLSNERECGHQSRGRHCTCVFSNCADDAITFIIIHLLRRWLAASRLGLFFFILALLFRDILALLVATLYGREQVVIVAGPTICRIRSQRMFLDH
jgi:hypothetical protein